ncbi:MULTISPECIES: hypothetical protein [unclassified Rickettsia]|uniref:hypothetical protein n=1 Tax=unclassified Rickettsia TaxID=114295 RepID=UPI0031334CC6
MLLVNEEENVSRHCEEELALLHGSKIAIFWVFFKSTAMSCRGQAHYCTNVEKRLCHAVT